MVVKPAPIQKNGSIRWLVLEWEMLVSFVESASGRMNVQVCVGNKVRFSIRILLHDVERPTRTITLLSSSQLSSAQLNSTQLSSAQQCLNHVSVNIRQPVVSAPVAVRQLGVVDAE